MSKMKLLTLSVGNTFRQATMHTRICLYVRDDMN